MLQAFQKVDHVKIFSTIFKAFVLHFYLHCIHCIVSAKKMFNISVKFVNLKLSLFMHAHSSPHSLAARSHQYCANHFYNVDDG